MGKPKTWKKLSEKSVSKCKVFDICRAKFEHPDGRKGDFYLIKSSDWVQAIPLFEGKGGKLEVLMVNQFRFAKRKMSWEFPGGVMESGESPLEGARRELLEETGFGRGKARLLAKINPNPAIQTNDAYVVLVLNPKRIAEKHWDANEELESKIVPVSRLFEEARKGKIKHSITLNAVYFLKEYLELKKKKFSEL